MNFLIIILDFISSIAANLINEKIARLILHYSRGFF